MIYLTLNELIHVADRTLDGKVEVRDYGLLEGALARPRTSVFGRDAYPDLETKAAALLHSLARNRALVDGNKRLALAATIAFLGMNGWRLTLSNNEAYEFIIAVAAGDLDDVSIIAARIGRATKPRCGRRTNAADSQVVQRGRMTDPARLAKSGRAPRCPRVDGNARGFRR